MFTNPFQEFYSNAGDYTPLKSQPLSFQLSPTTEKYDIGAGNIFGLNSSTAMQAGPLKPAENANQKGEKGQNALVSSFQAVQELMKGGKAIPSSLVTPAPGSGKVSGLNLSKYNSIDYDRAGNIIGLSGRMQIDPISGAPVGKIAPDFQAKTGELGSPYTPGLDAFKQAQIDSAKASAEAASTPAALQSQANRQAYIQSQISNLPKGATVEEIQTSKGTERTVSGPNGYAQAFIPKTKPEELEETTT